MVSDNSDSSRWFDSSDSSDLIRQIFFKKKLKKRTENKLRVPKKWPWILVAIIIIISEFWIETIGSKMKFRVINIFCHFKTDLSEKARKVFSQSQKFFIDFWKLHFQLKLGYTVHYFILKFLLFYWIWFQILSSKSKSSKSKRMIQNETNERNETNRSFLLLFAFIRFYSLLFFLVVFLVCL